MGKYKFNRLWFAGVVVAVVVALPVTAGAQTSEVQQDIEGLGGQLQAQDAVIEQNMQQLTGVGEAVEQSSAEVTAAEERISEISEQRSSLENQVSEQRRSHRQAESVYEQRALAAYKGESLDGFLEFFEGITGGREMGPGMVSALLSSGGEDIERYEQTLLQLAYTERQLSQKQQDYSSAVDLKRQKEEELRQRQQELKERLRRLGIERRGTAERLKELKAQRRIERLRLAPATGGAALDRGQELRIAREEIVARPVEPIPFEEYVRLYKKAARDYGFASDWYVLAAVGRVESNHGQNMGPSSAGAMGPMQFMPSTWKSHGVDGDGDGVANIMDPEDAIPAAAAYLVEGGAPGDWYSALYAYNHADWYVREVLGVAEGYRQLAGDDGVAPYPERL